MRDRALFLLAVLVGLAGVTPAWAGGGVVIRIGPRPAPSNVIIVSPPANVVVVQPPVLVVPRPVRRSIASPGFQPFSAQFITTPTFPARLRVALVPQ